MRACRWIVPLLTTLVFSDPSDAAMVTMRFAGIVGRIEPGPGLPSSLSLDDPFSGTFTYDDSLHAAPCCGGGVFIFDTLQPISLDFEVAGESFHLDGVPVKVDFGGGIIATQPSLMRIYDRGPVDDDEGGDSYDVEVHSGLGTSNGISQGIRFAGINSVGYIPDAEYFQLTPTSALSDFNLPAVPPGPFTFFGFGAQWWPPSSPGGEFAGMVTSLELVDAPEPRLAALFSTLLAALTLRLRHR